MKNFTLKFLAFILIFMPLTMIAQESGTTDSIVKLIEEGKSEQAYNLAKQSWERLSPSKDTAYQQATIAYAITMVDMSIITKLQGKYEEALKIADDLQHLITANKKYFSKMFPKLQYYATECKLSCHFSSGNYKAAEKERKALYSAYNKKQLPDFYQLNNYFNFDCIKIDSLNVWGYEWYDNPPKDRFSTSFTKIVYYVYSTNPDGSDKDLLYRLHVLMFHSYESRFFYIMDKRISTDEGEWSGSMYAYTYQKDIDYEKLHNDVIEIVKNNKETNSSRFIPYN